MQHFPFHLPVFFSLGEFAIGRHSEFVKGPWGGTMAVIYPTECRID